MSRAYAILVGILLVITFGQSQATTLGEINVLSAVGEPFSATIEVQLTGTDSADQMIPQIASAETHTAFGISYEDYASTIKIEVVQRKDKLLLVLNSKKDLREVYLEFIFQLQFITGSIYRAYSVLPDFNIPRMDGMDGMDGMEGPEKSDQRGNRPRKRVPAGSYTVQNLDSLWLIAAAMDRKLGSVTQRIRLLEAANPAVENGEIHPGDTLIIPADRTPLSKPAPQQKSRSGTNNASEAIGEPAHAPVEDSVKAPQSSRIIPAFASEKALAAVTRRAAGYRVVRLTARSGPQFSQSSGGVATLSRENNDTMSLELEEIRQNLEVLARENVILTDDIQRLKAQEQRRQDETERQERRYPLPAARTDIQPENKLAIEELQPVARVEEDLNQESSGLSNTIIFFIIILIFIGMAGMILWMKRKRENQEREIREQAEAAAAAKSTQDLTASISNRLQKASEAAEKKIEADTLKDANSPGQDGHNNSNKKVPVDTATDPETGGANIEPEKSRLPQHQATEGRRGPESTDFRFHNAKSENNGATHSTEESPEPVRIFPAKETIEFVPVDRSASGSMPETESEPDSVEPDQVAPEVPARFEDIEFVEEVEGDESETIDLKFELELDAEIESGIARDDEFEHHDEIEAPQFDINLDDDEAKSMSDVFEDLHLHDGTEQGDATPDLTTTHSESTVADASLTTNVARWTRLQQEWDNAIASGNNTGHSLAVAYIELDDMESIEDQQGPMRTEDLITQAQKLLAGSIQTADKSLHRIKDHTFLFLYYYKTETDLRERGKTLVRIIQDHDFVVRNEHMKLSLSVGIVPFTSLFNSLDDYLRCGKMTVAELRTELAKARISGGVAIHFEGSNEAGDWENEGEFLAKVSELLNANMFDVEYQTLINLSGNHQQVYMCKTELSPEVDTQALPANFLKKAFTCSATPAIERQSIMAFMDKIRLLGDDTVKMLFRIDIRSAMDPEFGGWLFHQLEVKGIDPTSITLFVYADDVIAYKPNIISFAATLRQQGSRLGMLNVDYDANHLQAALDVGASIVRINPSIVDDVVESSVRFGSRPVTSGTREISRFKDYLTSFQKRDIETVLFSTYVEAIPGLVVLNASNLRASYIQTPIGMIEDDPF